MSPITTPKQCDLECDVLVIGAGSAGLPASSTIAEAGYKALLIEDRAKPGGSLAMVAGGFACPCSDEQKAAGIEDSPDRYYNDLVKACDSDPELTRAYVDNVLDVYKILKEEGMVWPGLHDTPGHSATRDFGWLLGYGPKIVECLEKRCKKLGVPILYRHRGQRLTVDPATGRVNGAIVLDGQNKKFIKAKKGVILATGGFLHNKEIIAEFDPVMVDCIPKMPISHQGDGLKMALELGAATRHIGTAVAGSWPLCKDTHSRCIWALDCGGIMVNKYGKRFHNEGSDEGYYGFMSRAGMSQPDGAYFVIYDAEVEASVGVAKVKGAIERNMEQVKDLEQCKRYYAQTPEELAEKLGIDPAGFAETIAKWNADIAKCGYDTAFDRKGRRGGQGALLPLKAPFIGIKAVTSLTSAKGGLKINAKCQVINQFGEIIPGLYAAGEIAGGMWRKSCMLGVMSSLSTTQGLLAARAILEEIKDEVETGRVAVGSHR
jgi:fumarate reductase flavoprotein subunit